MPPRKSTPSYLLHKQSGRARAAWTDPSGIPRQRLLPGPFESPESLTAFAQLQLEIASSPHAPRDGQPVTLNQLLLAFRAHAEQHYRHADGTLTNEVREYAEISKLVRPLHGETLVRDFGPLTLKAVRQEMIGRGWCRSLINQRIGRLKRIFRWGVAEELVPAGVHVALSAVAGLQRGRCNVREADPVEPVDEDVVEATLPYLTRHVRGMVEFQRLTGCRPGEVCLLRRCDIDTGGEVWLYRPARHKTAWRGKARVIAIGPKAQELIRGFFTPQIGDYLFSPARMMAEFRAGQRARRQTPVQPSQATRAKPAPKKKPGDRYTSRSYASAVEKACKKAKTEHWHPNQLRHTFATKARKQHGLEAAQVLLGHARADVTQVYAERNLDLAVNVAAQLG